jgi:DNA-binding NarL/FixJ family response regulator
MLSSAAHRRFIPARERGCKSDRYMKTSRLISPVPERPAYESLRVVIADDHPFYRRGLARLLRRTGIEVVGEAPNGEAALSAAAETQPDLVIMDLNMPGLSGLDATRRLIERSPGSRVLMLSVSAQETDVSNAILAGASGYVLKDEPGEEIIAAIEVTASGESMISPRIAAVLLRGIQASIEAGEDLAGGGLSVRELEVLTLLAGGTTDSEIAETLDLGSATVGTYVTSILKKLQLEKRVTDVSATRNHRG